MKDLLEAADQVLEWLNTVSDEELFEALEQCDSVVHYAIQGK